MVGDDIGAVAVRADLEGVVVLDLQEIGDLPEDPRDARLSNSQAFRLNAYSSRRAPPAPAPRRSPRALVDRNRRDSRRRQRRTPWRPWRRLRPRARSVIDRRRGHAGRQPFPVGPFLAICRPTSSQSLR